MKLIVACNTLCTKETSWSRSPDRIHFFGIFHVDEPCRLVYHNCIQSFLLIPGIYHPNQQHSAWVLNSGEHYKHKLCELSLAQQEYITWKISALGKPEIL